MLPGTGHSGGLTLCPSDVVATSGDSVILRAAGKPGSSLRWYKYLNSTYSGVIFTGRNMNYKQVDHRYDVQATREIEKSLVIHDVKAADAGQFTVREEFSRQSASVNVVVIGKLSHLVTSILA